MGKLPRLLAPLICGYLSRKSSWCICNILLCPRPRYGCEVLRSACLCVVIFVFLFVCFSALISHKPHVQIYQIFCSAVTEARSSSGGYTIRYVLPVLWKTSCFHIMDRIGQCQTTHMFCPVRQVAALGRSLPSPTASCHNWNSTTIQPN